MRETQRSIVKNYPSGWRRSQRCGIGLQHQRPRSESWPELNQTQRTEETVMPNPHATVPAFRAVRLGRPIFQEKHS